jgi:hypothetical protein
MFRDMRSLIRCTAVASVFGIGSLQSEPLRAQSEPVRVFARRDLPNAIARPSAFDGCRDRAALVDFGDMSVHRLNSSGALTGRYAKVGRGPMELLDIGGIQFDSRCRLWIGDTGNSRIVVLDTAFRAIRALPLENSIRALAPVGNGERILAVPQSVQDMLHLLDGNGRLLARIPYPADLAAMNPIVRERYLAVANDSLVIVQFRWFDRRLVIDCNGRTEHDVRGAGPEPKVLEIPMGRTSRGYRVDPSSREFAEQISAGDGRLMVIRNPPLGPNDEATPSTIGIYDTKTGQPLGSAPLRVRLLRLASVGARLLGIGETDAGYAVYVLGIPPV